MWDVVWTFAGVLGWAYVFAVGERLARRVAGPPELSATIEKGDVEARLAALERNFDRTRELFIDVLSITLTLLADLYLKPVGAIANVLVIGGTYTAVNIVIRFVLRTSAPPAPRPEPPPPPKFPRRSPDTN